MTSGLQKSDLVILAARPSMGKTAFAMNIAQNAAVRGGKVVGVFSLEMSRESLLLRLLCAEANVDAHKLRTGFLGRQDYGRLRDALGRLAEARLFIDDTPSISVSELRARARRLQHQQGGLDLVVVDYLQLMSGTPSNGPVSPEPIRLSASLAAARAWSAATVTNAFKLGSRRSMRSRK
jgi:replicative DNA helicase